MKLIFPFKNISTNRFLEFVEERENIQDFVLTEKNEYPYSKNYFLAKVDHFKNSLPNFENEILQVINTTNQSTIDSFFDELLGNISYIRQTILLEEIELSVKKWNDIIRQAFEETVEKETIEYFKNENRKRKHLEEYEPTEFEGIKGLWNIQDVGKKKRINYNYYCIDKQPELIDESYCKQYQLFLSELGEEYLEVARRYGIPYSKGEIVSKIEQVIFVKPVVFVEGEYDIIYITRAAELLNKMEVLEKVDLRQRGGWSNLNKLWEIYKDNNWETVPQKKLLLYDCDTNVQDDQTGSVFKRIIKTIPGNTISKGIENLFPNSLIEKAIQEKKEFVDITKTHRTKRGIVSEETIYVVNRDEKKNLCTWICENGAPSDFSNFQNIFDIISTII